MIPLVKSTFYNEKEVKKSLSKFISNSRKLSFGRECEKFERNFAIRQKRKFCIFVNSGSSANLATIQALLNLGKLKKGDSVGFSALTWSTDVMPLIQLGLNPIPVDIEIDTLNVSSKKLLDRIKKYPMKAMCLTNLLGFCDDIDEIRNICDERKVILIEDNCESLGTVYKGKLLGNYSFASTFSFYVGHHMSTIEGGAICTDDEEFATMLKIVRAHGWDRNLTQKGQTELRNKHKVNYTFYSRYTFYDLGYNFRPTEINGLIGNTQLRFLKEIIEERRKNFLYFASEIYSKKDKYYPIKFDHIDLISNFAVPVICKSKKIRDILVERCAGKVEIRPIVGGDTTRQPFFFKYVTRNFLNPNARLAHEQGFYFGNNPELTQREKKTIIDILGD